MRRDFVTVGDRQVHFRYGGTGPPVLLVHAPPGSSASLVPLGRRLAVRRSVFAVDLPGYGESDPLGLDPPTIGDYGVALGQAADALGLGCFDLFGSGAGGAVALRLAVTQPERVRHLCLENLGLFSDEERADMLANGAPPFVPESDGSHLVRAWSMCREAHLFRPWYRPLAANRVARNMPAPEMLHDLTVDLLRAGTGYGLLSRAALLHDPTPELGQVRMPCRLVYIEGDPCDHRARLPALPPNVRLQVAPPGSDAACLVSDLPDEVSGATLLVMPIAKATAPSPNGLTRHYVTTSAGQMHVRRGGNGDLPLVMIHSSPSSGASLAAIAETMASTGSVIVPDTMNYGDSDHPGWSDPTVEDFARVLLQALDSLSCDRFAVYGTHTGAVIALELARIVPHRIQAAILDGLPLFTAEEQAEYLEHYLPSFHPRWDGSHLLRIWHYRRNQALFWPWYHQAAESIVRRDVLPARLQQSVLDQLKAGDDYRVAYRAVFRHPTEERLRDLGVPTLISAIGGDPMEGLLGRALASRPDIVIRGVPGFGSAKALQETAKIYRDFLELVAGSR